MTIDQILFQYILNEILSILTIKLKIGSIIWN